MTPCVAVEATSTPHVCSSRCRLPSGLCVEAFIAAHPDGATLGEIGKVWGISRERVRQIERDARRKLRRKAAP